MSILQVGLKLLLSPLGANIVTRTACCTVGIAFPVYSTFKAIEEKERSEQERWLLYWAAYGSFSLVETFSDKILSWFPLYYHMKFVFLVWLQLPSGNGARHLYSRHLRPFLLKHQDRLDQLHDFITREIMKFTISHQGEIEFLKGMLKRFASTANLIVKEAHQPVQRRGQNTIEGPNELTRPRIQGSGSDSEN
ncbi:HVA22-like protein k isoform X2 [Asparagus officinalis]|uniref:HVA22-like protein k isoform X2 n=1 Tax=Asparagus officinalis TaxID=4686 RepID=UPI00098E8333|nr:HVA22-like protein k isoform X2 [Asparagus officinalis]